MIQTSDITDKTLIDSYQKQAITLNTQDEITTATTRLWVTSFCYLRLWRWMTKNLSIVIAKTPKNEAKTNKLLGMAYALTTAQ